MDMDAPPHSHPNDPVADYSTAGNTPEPSNSTTTNGPIYSRKISLKQRKKKKKESNLDTASSVSSGSSNNCCSAASLSQGGFKISRNPRRIRVGSMMMTRRNIGPRDVDALALPLGMSIAAVVAQVLERTNDDRRKVSVDNLSKMCISAVRESLVNVYGDKFDSFVANFEKSFRSTLMTLKLINQSSKDVDAWHQRVGIRKNSHSVASIPPSLSRSENSTSPIDDLREFAEGTSIEGQPVEENMDTDWMNWQLILHDGQARQQLACASESISFSNSPMLSIMEKSVSEQTRSNDLKAVEIGLRMEKIKLKKTQLSLNSNSNQLERCKISMGISKASFKAEKFKTEVQDTKQVELLKTCLDLLVAGLMIMLVSLAYSTYIYSHRRITEATEACSPPAESKSWWMPKSMSTFNTGLHLLKCQIQVLSRMLFGLLMIGLITFLLFQRSSSSHQTMPVTIILLLLGVGCGYTGKFCVDTLGGCGKHWLIYWEVLCLLHFFSYIFLPRLFFILNGPINITERMEDVPKFPYWLRRLVFYATLLVLPLSCGLLPFANFWEWIEHFSSQTMDYMVIDN